MERFSAWMNPFGTAELAVPGERKRGGREGGREGGEREGRERGREGV